MKKEVDGWTDREVDKEEEKESSTISMYIYIHPRDYLLSLTCVKCKLYFSHCQQNYERLCAVKRQPCVFCSMCARYP